MLPPAAAEVSASTVNRKLAAVSAFYAHQAATAPGRPRPGTERLSIYLHARGVLSEEEEEEEEEDDSR